MPQDHDDEPPELVTGDLVGPEPLPGLVTLAEAAQGWAVSVRTLRRRIAAGDLPGAAKLATPAGDTWHVAPVELEALGIKRRGGAATTEPGAALVAAQGMVDDLVALLEAHRQATADAEAAHLAAAVEAAELRTRVAALDELRELEAAKLTTERDHVVAERDRLAARVAELEAAKRRRWWQR
jgi:hypothetical protein